MQKEMLYTHSIATFANSTPETGLVTKLRFYPPFNIQL